ncbi:MAG: hypothetical protein NW224_30195 [Leptolyngbyaceae cyanobacterium bins.302]|nr:hypothetical protein [Leptolyngbyaceae cyanobacterium bins.302]
MKSLFQLIPLTLSSLLLLGQGVIAAPVVRQLSQSQAQGLAGNGAQVTVWAGSGTNIDFTRTGERIQRAWVDDPSRVVVDFDAPLCSDGGGNCTGGASFIHLRRVTGIHFPNLPQTPSTLLTVITRSPQNSAPRQYLFQVTYGSGAPQYAALAITPDSHILDGVRINGDRTANWNDIERGLQRAIAQQIITRDSPVVMRVQTFLTHVRNGTPLEQASQQAGVPLTLLTRLAEIGYPITTSSSAE